MPNSKYAVIEYSYGGQTTRFSLPGLSNEQVKRDWLTFKSSPEWAGKSFIEFLTHHGFCLLPEKKTPTLVLED